MGGKPRCWLLGAFIPCLILNLRSSESAHFTVIASHQPVTVAVGNDAVLSCHLSPRISAEDMEVSWLSAKHRLLVHVYQNKKDQPERQSPKYQGRTELIRDGITNGSVSLRIFNITPSDEGQYKCFFASSDFYNAAELELRVTGSGTNPQIYIEGYEGGGIKVVCRTSGWYPEPEMIWQEANGQHLLSLATNKTHDHYGLFTKETSLIVREDSNRKLSCCLRHTYTREERESTVYIEALFFPRMSPYLVSFIVTLFVFLGFAVLSVHCFRSQRHAKDKLLKEKERLSVEIEWRKACSHAVEVTVDPETANPYLVVSEDKKCMSFRETKQAVPNNEKRFDVYSVALGCEGFIGGKQYWEVEVEMGEQKNWGLGVARESVPRKGYINSSPANGIWCLDLYFGEYRALTDPERTPLSLSEKPTKIGIYLDYEGGQLSFYNVNNMTHIYSYAHSFTEKMFPYFYIRDLESSIRLCY
ncbi:butyrophilin subfamily 1 member A1-like [Rhinatrema bivittatum]|uniref:butyrophilin subfamily 1 member A1-like n=1 Tax=Rhinatrema bivittatum TaxID=194408 RepID=UPI001129E359|nr:butyrophilin subfamily 1 member A1-like [Rhinatrema bivittatum]XP_029463013.1 butyrophilin subfamily 1 member A1-like [Rhinatrema bivittatum]XP_029463015.1 butyrophilin subfamily 1 member A1-like [Rhinatrema bivittatum]